MNTHELIHVWQGEALHHILPTPEVKTLYHLNLLEVYRAWHEDKYYLKVDRSWAYYLESKVMFVPTVYVYKFYEVI